MNEIWKEDGSRDHKIQKLGKISEKKQQSLIIQENDFVHVTNIPKYDTNTSYLMNVYNIYQLLFALLAHKFINEICVQSHLLLSSLLTFYVVLLLTINGNLMNLNRKYLLIDIFRNLILHSLFIVVLNSLFFFLVE